MDDVDDEEDMEPDDDDDMEPNDNEPDDDEESDDVDDEEDMEADDDDDEDDPFYFYRGDHLAQLAARTIRDDTKNMNACPSVCAYTSI